MNKKTVPIPNAARISLKDVIGSHENNFTIVRLILAASVILYHAPAFLPHYGHADPITDLLHAYRPLGILAVEVFFFLSGLFVAQSYAKDPNSLRFAAKRFLRIWPGLFVCLVITAAISCALSPDGLMRYLKFSGFYDYINNNALLNSAWVIDGVFSDRHYKTINGSIHTLPFEAMMYVILAIAGIFGVFRWRKTIGLFALAIIFLVALPEGTIHGIDRFVDDDWTRRAMMMFFVGVLFYACAEFIVIRIWQLPLILIAFAIHSHAVNTIAFYAAVIWVTLYVGQARWIGRLFRPKADLSYGIYVYGWPVQQFVISLMGNNLNIYVFTAVSLAGTIVFAAFSWYVIEKPSMSLGNYLYIERIRKALTDRRRPLVHSTSVVAVLLTWFGITTGMAAIAGERFAPPVTVMATRITGFGPASGKAGHALNPQPDGTSAMWLNIDNKPIAGTMVIFNGHPIEPTVGKGIVTIKVPQRYLETSGEKSIYLERKSLESTTRSNAVTLQLD